MIVQHTDKECKTKFSIGVEFKNSLYGSFFTCEIFIVAVQKIKYNIV